MKLKSLQDIAWLCVSLGRKHAFYKDSPSVFQLGDIIEGFVHILEKYLRKLVYFDGVVLYNGFFEKERKRFSRMVCRIIYLFII